MCAVAQRIGELAKGWCITAATCGEIKDLDKYGVEHNRCIDDRLMIKCFSHDKCLMDFLAGDNSVGRTRRARRRQYEMPSLPFFESGGSVSSQYTKYHVQGHRRVQHLPASVPLLLREHEQRCGTSQLETILRLPARRDDNEEYLGRGEVRMKCIVELFDDAPSRHLAW